MAGSTGDMAQDGETPEPAVRDGRFAENACLNCDAPLARRYCAECGQEAHLHRTLGAYLHEIGHGVAHFEGRIWRTLPMLALHPGRLTREYIDGRRARHVSPMALFLFSVFMLFAVFQIAGLASPAEVNPQVGAEAGMGRIEGSVDLEAGDGKLAEGLRKWRDNPGLMLYKLQANSYKFSWLLIPLSLPFVWLMFAWKRRFGLYDHAVFVTYSIAFMTLLFIALALAGVAGAPAALLEPLGAAAALAHLFVHVKGAYELSVVSALWRLLALAVSAAIVLVLFMLALLALGTFG